MPAASMRALLSLVLDLSRIGLGLWRIIGLQSSNTTVAGVDETGSFNPHFAGDVGCAFLAVGRRLA